jgi:hypothetical protein
MAKRARFDGPHDAIEVPLPSGRIVVVERGHQLPDEVKNERTGEVESVPASLRDELLARDGWTAVDVPTGPKKDEE